MRLTIGDAAKVAGTYIVIAPPVALDTITATI